MFYVLALAVLLGSAVTAHPARAAPAALSWHEDLGVARAEAALLGRPILVSVFDTF